MSCMVVCEALLAHGGSSKCSCEALLRGFQSLSRRICVAHAQPIACTYPVPLLAISTQTISAYIHVHDHTGTCLYVNISMYMYIQHTHIDMYHVRCRD